MQRAACRRREWEPGGAAILKLYRVGPGTADLPSAVWGAQARVKTPVTALDGSKNPIRVDDVIVSSAAVPVSTVPVFVQSASGSPSGIGFFGGYGG